MTPTLMGRLQTRLILYIFIALPVTLLYALFLDLGEVGRLSDPFVFISAMTLIGFILDPFYIQIQRFRWDNDWPFAFQFFFTILEFLVTLGLMSAGALDGFLVSRIDSMVSASHFFLVFIPSFLALLGGLQIFMIRWRFKGGEVGRF